MTQVKDFPSKIDLSASDFLYLITEGNTDYKVLINTLLGDNLNKIIQATYEFVLTDQYKTIRMSFSGGKTLTVPEEAGVEFTIGTVIRVRNASAGTLSLVGGTVGVVLNTKSGLNIEPRGEAKLVYIGADEWDVTGDLTA